MLLENIGLSDKNYIILDTETTGLGKNDEVIELGIIDLDGKTLYSNLFNPGYEVSPFITSLTGIENLSLSVAPSFKNEWPKIKEIIKGKQVIGHNVGFDIRLLDQTLYRHAINCNISDIVSGTIDSIRIIKNRYKFDSYKQSEIAKKFNITELRSHRAVNDCLMLLEILKKINIA